MNKGFAQAWDEVAEHAAVRGGVLERDGHRFMYAYDVGGVRTWVWAEENAPRFGVRRGEFSARCFNVASVELLVRTWGDDETHTHST